MSEQLTDEKLDFIHTGSLPGWSWQNAPTQEEVHSMAEELIQRRKPDASLVAALKDYRWASTVRPSCQKGVVDVCHCMTCVDERAIAALRDAGETI